MGSTLAFTICAIGTAGLFYLDRDGSVRTSRALWLPVIWLWIIGSRPVSDWLASSFGMAPIGAGQGLDAQLEGSPVDALVFLALSLGAIVVLACRGRQTVSLLKSSLPVLIYFTYCLVSCLWSPFPDVAFKRWTKDIGDLAMVLVIATDPEPLIALRRIFSRVGLVLLPASLVLIRYSALGRGYDPEGNPANTGVTTNKNELGLITFVILLGAFWSFYHLLRAKRHPNRGRHLVARGALVALGIVVLQQAHSATSVACFMLGAALILVANLPFFKRRTTRIHLLIVGTLLLGGIAMLFGGEATVAGALGRNANLSDRTTIWAAVIPANPNAFIGAGFESFWNGYGKNVKGNASEIELNNLNSAHNGYIQVWLDLGWVGVALIAQILINGYRRAYSAFRLSIEVGGLMLAYIATSSMYSITEAGFRIVTPSWFFLLLVLVGSRSIAAKASRGTPKGISPSVNRLRGAEFAPAS